MIAYLILAHDDIGQLIRLIRRLKSSGEVFVHLDNKSNKFFYLQKLQELHNFHLVSPRVNVFWGGFSLVEATLRLMEAATEKGATRLCLLSESCWPIVDNTTLENTIEDDFDYLNIGQSEVNDFHPFENRFSKFWPMDCAIINPKMQNRDPDSRYLKDFIASLPRRELPTLFKVYIGSNWMCLRVNTFKLILETINKNSEFYDFFKYALIPDEAFFQSIIGYLIDSKQLNFSELKNNLHYVDFTQKGIVGGFPKVLDKMDIEVAKNSGKLFARKIISGISDDFCNHFS